MSKKIAYIVPIKAGMLPFVYREVKLLKETGMDITLYATQFGKGLYMPQQDWKYHYYSSFIVVLMQPVFFLKNPAIYLKLLKTAIKTRSVACFLIAFYYAPIMEKDKIDKIHSHEGLSALHIGYYCSKLLNIPISVTIHADTFYANPRMEITKLALNECEAIITISKYNKKILAEQFQVNPQKVLVIRLGVDLDQYNKPKKKKILIVGVHTERKGHDILFKAINQLSRNDVELWVVGSGKWARQSEYVDVKKQAQEIGISNNTLFFEDISDELLKILYQSCDIFCLPSRTSSIGNKEGIPTALMEAMAFGKPVISTYHTGIPELVEGILVEENDVTALSAALSKLLDNPQLREEMGKRNREIITTEYSLPDNVNKLATYFKEGRCI